MTDVYLLMTLSLDARRPTIRIILKLEHCTLCAETVVFENLRWIENVRFESKIFDIPHSTVDSYRLVCFFFILLLVTVKFCNCLTVFRLVLSFIDFRMRLSGWTDFYRTTVNLISRFNSSDIDSMKINEFLERSREWSKNLKLLRNTAFQMLEKLVVLKIKFMRRVRCCSQE